MAGRAGRGGSAAAGRGQPRAEMARPARRAARLAGLLAALLFALALFAPAAANCGGSCSGCKKRKCKNDDRCFYADKFQVARPECQDVGIDVCRLPSPARCELCGGGQKWRRGPRRPPKAACRACGLQSVLPFPSRALRFAAMSIAREKGAAPSPAGGPSPGPTAVVACSSAVEEALPSPTVSEALRH